MADIDREQKVQMWAKTLNDVADFIRPAARNRSGTDLDKALSRLGADRAMAAAILRTVARGIAVEAQ